MAASEWAKAKAREGDEARLLGGYLNPRWLERLRSEVLEEAAAAADAVRDRYDAAAAGPGVNEAQECADAIRALKHTEGDDG